MNMYLRLFLFLLLVGVPVSVKADYFVWQDAQSRLSLSFPDTWKVQNNRNPRDVLTISGPAGGDDPVCTIKTNEDKRYVIYPPELGDAVQKVAVSTSFWESYMGHYDNYALDRVYDGAGLGRWLASYATATYSHHNGTAREQRRGIMFASLYYDTLYVIECSSRRHTYSVWEDNFKSIIKSVDFKKVHNERKTGHYTDFLKGADLYFWAQTGPEGTVRY